MAEPRSGITPPFLLLLLLLLLLPLFSFSSAQQIASPRRRCHGHSRAGFIFPDFSDLLLHRLNLLSLFGDAHLLPSQHSLQISGPLPGTSGGAFFSRPLRLLSKPAAPDASPASLSFSSSFSFSMDSSTGGGLAFFISPAKPQPRDRPSAPSFGLLSATAGHDDAADFAHLPRTLVVEFDVSMDGELRDPSDKHVGIDVESLVSVATADVDDVNGFSGGKVFAWIDYRAAPRNVLEVRVSRTGERPEEPMLSYAVDLSQVWRQEEEMYVGFSSATGDAVSPAQQRHVIYSWAFIVLDKNIDRKGDDGRRVPDELFWGRRQQQQQQQHRRWPEQDFWHHHDPNHRPLLPHDDEDDDHQWHPHPHPDPNHHHHHHPHPHPHPHPHHHDEDYSSSWFGDLDDFWGILLSLLFGAACGSVVAGVVYLLWSFIRHRLQERLSAEQSFMLFGYPIPDEDGKAAARGAAAAAGYQKLPTREEGKDDAEEAC